MVETEISREDVFLVRIALPTPELGGRKGLKPTLLPSPGVSEEPQPLRWRAEGGGQRGSRSSCGPVLSDGTDTANLTQLHLRRGGGRVRESPEKHFGGHQSVLCGPACFSLEGSDGGSDATCMLGKKRRVRRGLRWGPRRALRLRGVGVGWGAGLCGQISKGLTMVKPESLLLPLLSSSGLELALLEEAEARPISGSEKTSGKRVRPSPFPAALLRVRRGWAWLGRAALAPPPSSSLETRMKSSALPLSACSAASGGACEAQSGRRG